MKEENDDIVCFPTRHMDWKALINHRNLLTELMASSDLKYIDSLNTAIAVIEQLLIYQNYKDESVDVTKQ